MLASFSMTYTVILCIFFYIWYLLANYQVYVIATNNLVYFDLSVLKSEINFFLKSVCEFLFVFWKFHQFLISFIYSGIPVTMYPLLWMSKVQITKLVIQWYTFITSASSRYCIDKCLMIKPYWSWLFTRTLTVIFWRQLSITTRSLLCKLLNLKFYIMN